MIQNAAILYAILAGIIVVFQVVLAFGAPWGFLAMGGRWPGRLPAHARVAVIAQALLLVVLAVGILTAAGLLRLAYMDSLRPGIVWAAVVVSFVATVLNTITPSRWERIWAPVALAMLVSSVIVLLG